MTKTIWDYQVSYGYGNVPGYGGFHTGEDRGNSSAFGLPVTVNGITIGTVGWTGRVEPKNKNGTHTHIGRWANGTHTNPGGGGQNLGQDAVVTQVDTVGNTDNGKFVRVRSNGVDWLYLHLDSVRVKVGDKLQGGSSVSYTPKSIHPDIVRQHLLNFTNNHVNVSAGDPVCQNRFELNDENWGGEFWKGLNFQQKDIITGLDRQIGELKARIKELEASTGNVPAGTYIKVDANSVITIK